MSLTTIIVLKKRILDVILRDYAVINAYFKNILAYPLTRTLRNP